jgi:N-formylglutamate amidohydrolase
VPGVLWRKDPVTDPVPLVFDAPHSGTQNPPDFRFTCDSLTIKRGADLFVDELYEDAPRYGATLIGALFPRAYIDANRAETDIYHAGHDGPEQETENRNIRPWNALVRTQNWRGGADFYGRKLTLAEIHSRIDSHYRPYHDVLRSALDTQHARFGGVWHVNCHSCRSMNRRVTPPRANADFIIGDRFGRTCSREFTDLIADTLAGLGYAVSLNKPYQGATLIRRYAAPDRERHSIQIEINKSLYLNDAEKSENFGALRRDIGTLVARISDYVRANAKCPQRAITTTERL